VTLEKVTVVASRTDPSPHHPHISYTTSTDFSLKLAHFSANLFIAVCIFSQPRLPGERSSAPPNHPAIWPRVARTHRASLGSALQPRQFSDSARLAARALRKRAEACQAARFGGTALSRQAPLYRQPRLCLIHPNIRRERGRQDSRKTVCLHYRPQRQDPEREFDISECP
jgi:hypothetical protein